MRGSGWRGGGMRKRRGGRRSKEAQEQGSPGTRKPNMNGLEGQGRARKPNMNGLKSSG
jgi:hypothetical protein